MPWTGGPLPPGGGTVRHPARVPLADLPPQRRPPPPGQREVVRRVDEGRPGKAGPLRGGRGRHPGPEMRPRSGRVPAAGAGDPAGLSHAQGELDHPSPGRLREAEKIRFLLDQSYALAGGKPEQRRPAGHRDWLIPANPKYYDVEAAFAAQDIIRWKQSSRVAVGDTIYLYVAAPSPPSSTSAGRWRCTSPSAAPGGRCGWTM